MCLSLADSDAFARATVNRYMNWLLGRGLVDPVDDRLLVLDPPRLQPAADLGDHHVDLGLLRNRLDGGLDLVRLGFGGHEDVTGGGAGHGEAPGAVDEIAGVAARR